MKPRSNPVLGTAACALLLVVGGCAAAIREEAGRADRRLAPEASARLLGRAWSALEQGKRIFDVRVADRRRVVSGEGAIVYEKDPLRLRLDVFGPHASPFLVLAQTGDTLAVRLPEERRFVRGPAGDMAFAELTGGRTFTGHELLGALLGAYDPAALLTGPADTVGYDAGGEWVVALLEGGTAHRFAYARADSSLREYRQERGGRPAYRVRFSDYRNAEGRRRPFRVELEDAAERRTVRVTVLRETFRADLPPEAYRLEPAGDDLP